MEYCGNSLQKTMITHHDFSEQIESYIYKWLLNTAKGLQCMHSANYAHLDIKPANIVIDTHTQESKLIDFGLIFNFPVHTSAYKLPFAGTPNYMSPEIIKRSEVSSVQKCDVYSLGITFIECAFAFHYNHRYNECKNNKKSSSLSYLMQDIFRYVPPVESQSESKLESLTLLPVIENKSGYLTIIAQKHPIGTIVYTKKADTDTENADTDTKKADTDTKKADTDTETINYTLGDLYRDILDIHEKYPILRRMIIEDHNGRCTIDDVISACKTKLM